MNEPKSNLMGVTLIIMICMVLTLIAGCFLTSCTYSITMVHTEGEAQDVVDETATNTPSTSVTIPIKPM